MEPFLPKKVIVKVFPVATTDNIEDFNKPILKKELDSIIINVGTNKQKGCTTLALQNEGDAHAHKTNLVPDFN